MRIQLLLADQEVELNKNVQIPLNKSFKNLWNPSDIIVDYSKTISIPVTTINNRILGNIYRIDRTIVENAGVANIGVYLDPTKKIPFQLLYNGQSLMEGYAKFTSSNYSNGNKTYNLNLFGTLGAFFLKMKSIVTSPNRLTDNQLAEDDGGAKYVLNDHINDSSLTADYVKKSWMNVSNNVNDFTDPSIIDQDIIGFAPSYRGYYGMDFKSNKVQTADNKIISLSEQLKNEWRNTYCLKNYNKTYIDCSESELKVADEYAEKLGADNVIGDGLKDYQMNEYRSYHQRPFIYLNKLMYMYKEKSKELTGYDLVLDPYWFNKNNPYWTKLVYTLNYLEDIEELPAQVVSDNFPVTNFTFFRTPINQRYGTGSGTFKYKTTSSYFEIDTLKISSMIYLNLPSARYSYGLTTRKHCAVVYKLTVNTSKGSQTIYKWSSIGREYYQPPVSEIEDLPQISVKVQALPFYYTKEKDFHMYIDAMMDGTVFNLPEGAENEEISLTIDVDFYSDYDSLFYLEVDYWDGEMLPVWNYFDYLSGNILPTNFSIRSNVSNSISLGLDILYLDEAPLFDVIIQYAKMFNLLWKVDDVNKTITLCRKSTYFNNIEVENWDDKLDRSKDYIIEPVTFDTKYVDFNYEDIDGYKYKAYKDKYGCAYGSYKLNTTYDFDSGSTELFTDINPSLVSQRSFVKYKDLSEWDLKSYIPSSQDITCRIESVSTDDSSAINESSWYFREGNVQLDEPTYITDDSELMISNGEYCWYVKAKLSDMEDSQYAKLIHEFPIMSLVSHADSLDYGCLFTCPKEDYTTDKSISQAKGYYIYDNFWKDYINELYNIQNKRLTAYFNILPNEYLSFDFNKFVTLDGQLFMVNKIFDYDLNSSATTKCELVQVTDMSVYNTESIVFGRDDISYTITVVANPSDAVITLNGNKTNSITAPYGTIVNYSVSKSGFATRTGSVTITKNETINIDLTQNEYVFAITPTPSDAIVTMNGEVINSIKVPYGTIVEWKVEKEGYRTQMGEYTVTSGNTLSVVLYEETQDTVKFTIKPTPSDASVSIKGIPTNSLNVEKGTQCDWSVVKKGYITQVGYEVVNEDTEIEVTLKEKQLYKVTYNPTPSDAFVKIIYNGEETSGIGAQSIYAYEGDMLSFTISKDGYKDYSGGYMVESFDKVHNITLDEIGYTFKIDGTYLNNISAGSQVVKVAVSSYDDLTGKLLVPTISNVTDCNVTIEGQANRAICNVSISENNTTSNRNIGFTLTQPGSGKTIDINITQKCYSYTFESFSLVPDMEYSGGQASVWVKSTRDGKAFNINKNNVSITGITGAVVNKVELDISDSEVGMYRIDYTIPENTGSSNRYATITVTHPVLSDVITLEFEQNYYDPNSTKKVATVITPIYNQNMSTISYELYFDATNYSGGTLKNVYVQVRNTPDATGNLIASKSYGDITVDRGAKSDMYIGLFKNIDLVNPWVLVYYDNNLQYKANCMQEQPEIDPYKEGE